MDNEPSDVAIIGAGPSGLFTAQALTARNIRVDVIDALAAPFGLVRYGIAPDHAQMKAVADVLARPLNSGMACLIGNVNVGTDVSLDELRAHYRAIVFATGCAQDRALDVPGERLDGSIGSGALVGWYSGHPGSFGWAPKLDHPTAVVVGAGNVALDVARILAKDADALRGTDMPDTVLAALSDSRVRDVHILIRRGPADAKFTPAELRQLGDLDDVEVRVHDEGALAEVGDAALDLRQRQSVAVMREWAAKPRDHTIRHRRIHLRFFRRVAELRDGSGACDGGQRVCQAVIADTRGDAAAETLEAGLVVRAVGYRAQPIAGLPFDPLTATVPNTQGRVLPGLYVAGWLKRGPSGVVGTNKGDGAETAAAMLADLPHLPPAPRPGREALLARLAACGVRTTGWDGWLRIDAAERQLGTARGAARIKVAERAAMLRLALGA